jgi:hypothetical protein
MPGTLQFRNAQFMTPETRSITHLFWNCHYAISVNAYVSVLTLAARYVRHIEIPDEHVVRQEHDAERNLFFNPDRSS